MGIIKQMVIIGGGSSIDSVEKEKLSEVLNNRCVIACNAQYRFWPHTFATWMDKKSFFENEFMYNYDDFTREKLWVCIKTPEHNDLVPYHSKQKDYQFPPLPSNHIRTKASYLQEFDISLQSGVYGNLTGMSSLTLAGYLMGWEGEVFLLGFDNKANDITGRTHSFSIPDCGYRYRGIEKEEAGQLPLYYTERDNKANNEYWLPFLDTNLKVYNVSPDSHIKPFEKIDYNQMFNLLRRDIFPQEQLRGFIRNKLAGLTEV